MSKIRTLFEKGEIDSTDLLQYFFEQEYLNDKGKTLLINKLMMFNENAMKFPRTYLQDALKIQQGKLNYASKIQELIYLVEKLEYRYNQLLAYNSTDREMLKFKEFVEHIYNHSDKSIPLEDWVLCKICNKTFKQITSR